MAVSRKSFNKDYKSISSNDGFSFFCEKCKLSILEGVNLHFLQKTKGVCVKINYWTLFNAFRFVLSSEWGLNKKVKGKRHEVN